jgi:hypothetical protein
VAPSQRRRASPWFHAQHPPARREKRWNGPRTYEQKATRALKTVGSQYSEVHYSDACGIRLFGPKVIPGLNNGMAVLARRLCSRRSRTLIS